MENLDKKRFEVAIDPLIADVSQKTIKNIIAAWYESGNELTEIDPDISENDEELLLLQINDCIKEEGGEISRQAKLVHLAMIYINLSANGKEKFVKMLAYRLDVDINSLYEKIKDLKSAKNEVDKINAEIILRDSLIPPRVLFLRQLITLPNGFIFLKDLRKNLLPIIKTDLRLKKLSNDIKTLLTTYFDVNMLDMEEITWNSSAAMLERLMKFEAVHEISSWNELKHRLFTDRKVFGFFHYKMPNEPLIFVEVALVKGMSDNIQKLIDVNVKAENPEEANTAIFYSISSTQKGLEGISFGNFLIKRVVKKISAEFPNIKTFATLSPVPKFRNWLTTYLENGGNNLLKADEVKKICNLSKNENANFGILELLNVKNWHKSKKHTDILRKPLLRLCVHYIFNIKKQKGFKTYDPVSNFHLSNGAKIEHINWLADISNRGISQSAGIMINYHYRLDKIAINHENYMTSGKVFGSSEVRAWLG